MDHTAHVGIGSSTGYDDDTAELMLSSHGRCREFAALAGRLASGDILDDERAELAAHVDRYFHQSLRLHIADEEESILPRIEAAASDPAERILLDDVRAEHRTIYALLAWLHPAWMALAHDPERFAARHPAEEQDLREGAARLAALLESHLDFEERRLAPSLARLPLAERAAIADEIHARREAAARADDTD